MARPHRSVRNYSASIANGASQSEIIKIDDCVAGGFFAPSAFTNVGATNLIRFGVSQNHGGPGAPTALIALVPTTTLATALSQRCAVSSYFPIPRDVFKHKYFRFDGVTTEGDARAVWCTFVVEKCIWTRELVLIANGAATSSIIKIAGAIGGSVEMPAALTQSAMTFHVSHDGNTFVALSDTGDTDISAGVAVDRHIPIPDGAFAFPYLRFVMGGNEGAARTLLVTLKR